MVNLLIHSCNIEFKLTWVLISRKLKLVYDVPAGVDKGTGDKYLIVTPGYKGHTIKGYIAIKSDTSQHVFPLNLYSIMARLMQEKKLILVSPFMTTPFPKA